MQLTDCRTENKVCCLNQLTVQPISPKNRAAPKIASTQSPHHTGTLTALPNIATLFNDIFPNIEEKDDDKVRPPPLYWHVHPETYLGVDNEPDEMWNGKKTSTVLYATRQNGYAGLTAPTDGEDEGTAYDATNGTISNGDLKFGP